MDGYNISVIAVDPERRVVMGGIKEGVEEAERMTGC